MQMKGNRKLKGNECKMTGTCMHMKGSRKLKEMNAK